MDTQRKVLTLITSIRESFIGSEKVYTEGSCFKLYQILKSQWSDAVPFINDTQDHVVTQIALDLYDINGLVLDEEPYHPMSQLEVELAETWIWNYYDTGVECPNCDSLFARPEIEKYKQTGQKPEWLKQCEK
jgi:hypothetical protein